MKIRWFWYISVPKVHELEGQTHSPIWRILKGIKTSVELTFWKIKASIGVTEMPPRPIVHQLNSLERKLRSSVFIPNVDQISDQRPVFFEFSGYSSKYIQKFEYPIKGVRKELRKLEREFFYPPGAFVVVGFKGHYLVVLVGNAKNMYGNIYKDTPISSMSQAPLLFLNNLRDNPKVDPEHKIDRNKRLLNMIDMVMAQVDWNSVALVRALSVFNAKVAIDLPESLIGDYDENIDGFDVRKAVSQVKWVVVGSPIYVEQISG
jgi:hypothetical protein